MASIPTQVSRRSFVVGVAAAGIAGAAATCVRGVAGAEEASAEGAADAEGATGTATVTLPGFGGDVTVTVTLEDGAIVDLVAEGPNETPERGGVAVAKLPEAVVSAGSLDVDIIAGATVTSNAIIAAAQMACNQIAGVDAGASQGALMAPGTYVGTAKGFWGTWDTPVTVTVNENAILSLSVPENRLKYGDTEVMMRTVVERLFPRIISSQSVKVDVVAGATVTSNTVKSAVEDALKQAIAAAGNSEDAVSKFYAVPAKAEEGVVEEKDVDILFIGMGTPCLYAMSRAIEVIREANVGRKVSILGIEKSGRVGGKSSLAHEFDAINPPLMQQILNGGEDFVDAVGYRQAWDEYYLDEDGNPTNKPDLVDLYFAESGNAIDWLYTNQDWRWGTPKGISAFPGNVLWNCILASGIDPGTFEDRRCAVDDLCRVMAQRAEAQGAEILLETEVYDYIVEGGAVVGAKARDMVTGKEYVVHAKAVVQDTGGYLLNGKLTTELANPEWAGEYEWVLSNGQDDGLMFEKALDAGAGTWNADMPTMMVNYGLPRQITGYPVDQIPDTLNRLSGRVSTTTWNDVPLALGLCANELVVNRQGRRFGTEAKGVKWMSGPYYYSVWSKGQLDKIAAEGFSTIIGWMEYCAQGDYPPQGPITALYDILDEAIEAGFAWKGETVAELGDQMEFGGAALDETVAAYNALCAAGKDADFGKDAEYLEPLEEGPFYAVRILNVPYASGGGLDVDASMRVLKADHETPIEGLFALGGECWGVLMHPKKHYTVFSGTGLGWGLVSGYVGGKTVADYVNEKYGFAEVGEVLDGRTVSQQIRRPGIVQNEIKGVK